MWVTGRKMAQFGDDNFLQAATQSKVFPYWALDIFQDLLHLVKFVRLNEVKVISISDNQGNFFASSEWIKNFCILVYNKKPKDLPEKELHAT